MPCLYCVNSDKQREAKKKSVMGNRSCKISAMTQQKRLSSMACFHYESKMMIKVSTHGYSQIWHHSQVTLIACRILRC